MPTYDGIGETITHKLEIEGDLFLQDVEGGPNSTQVPLEIFSNFFQSPNEADNSRMLRLRVQNDSESNVSNSYVTDFGIRGEPDKDYFFITAPQNTSNVGDQNTFVISKTSNVGIGTTDPGHYRLLVNNSSTKHFGVPGNDTPTTGDTLVYNESGEWVYHFVEGTLPPGTVNNEILTWNGTNWVPNHSILTSNSNAAIGIGTYVPNETSNGLHVVGSVTATNDVNISGKFQGGKLRVGSLLSAVPTNPNVTVPGDLTVSGTLTSDEWIHTDDVTITGNIGVTGTITTSNIVGGSPLTISTDSSNVIILNSNVGIGTTDPTKTLEVVGDIKCQTLSASTITGASPLTISADSISIQAPVSMPADAPMNIGTMTVSNIFHSDQLTMSANVFVTEGSTLTLSNIFHTDQLTMTSNIVMGSDKTLTTSNIVANTGENLSLNSNLFVDTATGNVGIGTDITSAPLHIYKSSNYPEVFVDYGAGGQKMSLATGTSGSVLGYSGYLVIGTITDAQLAGLSEKVRIDSSGNVGIGVASPTYKLHVSDDIYSGSGKLYLDAARSGESGVRGIFLRPGYDYNCSILTYDHNGNFSDGISINGYDGVSFCSGSDTRNEIGRFNSTGLNVNGTINNGSYAYGSGYMSGRTACFGDITVNYGGYTNGWQTNGRTAGLLLECLDTTEIAVHDAGAKVASLMYYSGNNITIGRNMNWGALAGLYSAASYFEHLGGSKIVIQNGVNGGNTRGLWLWTATDSNWGIYMGQSGGGRSMANGTAVAGSGFSSHTIRFRAYNGSTNGFVWENSSEQLLASLRSQDGYFYTAGYAYFNGGYGGPSDRRIKKDIQDLSDEESLNIIKQLKPKTFHWRDKQRSTDLEYGFIAQDIEEVFPSMTVKIQGEIELNKYIDFEKISDTEISIILDEKDSDCTVGDILYFKTGSNEDDYKKLNFTVISKTGNNITLKTDQTIEQDDSEQIFYIGRKVEDKMGIKGSYLDPLMISAIQQLERRLSETEAELQAEKQKMASLLARIEALENSS